MRHVPTTSYSIQELHTFCFVAKTRRQKKQKEKETRRRKQDWSAQRQDKDSLEVWLKA